MSDCVIIAGTLEAKLRNKLFAYFHQRYVELVYVEDNTNNDTSIGHYEMRLYKNKNKTESSLYSFIINPISMTCYINYMNSKQHKFTFVCSSQQTSICFSAHTKYERDQWISVLEQLQWQYQPNCNLSIKSKSKTSSRSKSSKITSRITSSKGTPVSSSRSSTSHQSTTDNIAPYDDESSDDDLYMNYNEYETKNLESISYIISLTEKESNYDNNYYYNYYQSSLISTNNQSNKINHQQCTCHDCQGQKFTILGILDTKSKSNDNINDHENKHKTTIDIDDELNFIKSPKYESIKSVAIDTNIPIPSIQT